MITITCPTCGHHGTYRSQALAEHHFPRHSCAAVTARRERAARVAARQAPSGEKSDCQHVNVHHEHGTRLAYALDQCRCRPCRNAANAYARECTRAAATGRPSRLVDAEPARQHVLRLMGMGMGMDQVAAVSGVSRGWLGDLLYGRHADNPEHPNYRPRSIRIDRAKAAALLATRFAPAGGATTDGTGTARRLRALVAAGWSQRLLSGMLSHTPTWLSMVVNRHQVRVTTASARAVRDLYDRLAFQTPPQSGPFERQAYTRAVRLGARRGWPRPIDWDDDTIDDPEAVAVRAERTPSRTHRRDDIVEDVEFLLDAGCGGSEVAARLGYRSPGSLYRALVRAGRRDLARLAS